MKQLKKMFAALMATTMLASMSVGTFADGGLTIGSSNESALESGLFIASNSIPVAAEEYAIKIFESLTPEDMTILEIGQKMDDIRLAHGFTAENTEIPLYYFPLLENDMIVGIMMVNYYSGSYGFQLGSNDFSDNLNSLETDLQNPAQIIVSENASYSKDKNGLKVLETTPEISSEMIEDEISTIPNIINFSNEKQVVNISSTNVYDAKIKEIVPYTLMGKKHTVAYVDNWTYTDGNELHGTCWASCVGSLVDFYQDGVANTSTAKDYRNKAKDNRKATTGKYSATSSVAVQYINQYSNSNITYRREDPDWATIKSTLLSKTTPSGQKGMPFYSHWKRISGDSSHAMVVCGYRYDDTQPNNDQYYSIYLMDPNREKIQLLQYRDAYIINNNVYSWEGSGR